MLAGPPNAGKSTLFNTLLGHERAIVSDLAGTTRDVLAEALTVPTDHGAAEVMLVDVAGHDDDTTHVGIRMQSSAADAHARAELILWCSPLDDPAPAPDDTAVVVHTKGDLGRRDLTAQQFQFRAIERGGQAAHPIQGQPALAPFQAADLLQRRANPGRQLTLGQPPSGACGTETIFHDTSITILVNTIARL